MREDMAAYDKPTRQTTPSRSAAGTAFIGQQKMISIKKHFGTTKGRYLYLSGWMVAALRSEFGPLPDQSMHEKTSVPALIEELYTFLRQADARELNLLFRDLDKAREAGDEPRRGSSTRSTITRPTSCRSSPTSTPVSATPRRPTCSPRR
jgi:isocitrate lyase